jgi:hypothetical protein
MSEIESKIALELGCAKELKCSDCFYGKFPFPCYLKTRVEYILALIAADRAGLVEALQQILYEVRVNHVNPEYRISQIAKGAIDSAMKGEGK